MKGFIQLSLMGWLALAAGAIILGLGIAVKVQTARLEASEAKHAAFVADVRAKGEEQERKTKEQIAADQKRKETADAENQRRVAHLNLTIKRLRDANTSSSFVPAPAAGSRRSDLACYGRERLGGAIREFVGETTSILEQLARDSVNMNTIREWANSSAPPPRQPEPRTPPSSTPNRMLEASK